MSKKKGSLLKVTSMAVANDRLNFIFLAEPRTASRATRDALLKLEGSYEVGTHHHLIEDLLDSYLKCSRDAYTVFSTIRNPADEMVTLWLQSGTRPRSHCGETFAEYIRRWGVGKPESFFFRHAESADQVIRYENLQKELDSLLRSFGVSPVKLEVVGPTEGKEPWFSYYTPRDLRYLLSSYPEIARWGYYDAIYRQIDLTT